MSPVVKRAPSVKKGTFVYGFPDSAYSNMDNGVPQSPRSPRPLLQQKPSIPPRRMPVDVPIPKI